MSRAFTLVEVLASLAVLGAAMAVVGLSTRVTRPTASDRMAEDLRAARAEAVRKARPIEWNEGSSLVRFRPDGSASPAVIVRDSLVVVIDPLTGGARAKRR